MTLRHGVASKRSTKRLKHTGHLFRKAFYGQRTPESSCPRKEIVDTDILVTSRGMVTEKSYNLSE